MLRLAIAGALGWTGQAVCRAALAAPDLQVVAAVARRHLGEPLPAVLGLAGDGPPILGEIVQALEAPPDVLIDYTHPCVAYGNVLAALERGVAVVLGTTGLKAGELSEIDRRARAAGLGVISGNFSITAALLAHLASISAQYLDDFEIVDYARKEKPDSPSGTATELAHDLGRIKRPRPAVAIADTIGHPESRGAEIGGVRVHSLRLPGFQLTVDAVFARPGERLIIRHEAFEDASVYAAGTLLAARRLGTVTGLVRGMNHLLFSPVEAMPNP